MKKWFLLFGSCFVFLSAANGQNPSERALGEQQNDAAMAAGYHEALASYLAQGGSIRTDKRGSRYMEGPIKGLTKAQATAQFNQIWARSSQEVREQYAARALNRGGTVEAQLEEQRIEAANKRRQEAEKQQKEQRERALRQSATITRSGDRIILDGDQTSGYRIQGNHLYDFSTGAHTHVRSGNLWMPINSNHFQILDP
jgi:hypothetical protein